MPTISDPWESGDPYALFMGRWSRPIAAAFVPWLGIPARRSWLDLGCGTGVMSQEVIRSAAPRQVIAVDPAPGFLDRARLVMRDPRVRFELGTASALPVESNTVDVLVSGLVLNFLPDLNRALTEMRRVVRPGGVIAAYVWDYADKMEMLRYFWDVAVDLDPEALDRDEGRRFPVCQPDELARQFSMSGLAQVEVRPIDGIGVFRDFDDYWRPFLGGQGPAPGYVAGLPEDARAALAGGLAARLPTRQDGAIELVLRAWAVKGTN